MAVSHVVTHKEIAMKKILLSVIAMSWLAAPAFAQDTGDKAHKSGGKMKATEKTDKKKDKKPEAEKKE
jgi:hypothetical protein